MTDWWQPLPLSIFGTIAWWAFGVLVVGAIVLFLGVKLHDHWYLATWPEVIRGLGGLAVGVALLILVGTCIGAVATNIELEEPREGDRCVPGFLPDPPGLVCREAD